MNIGFPDEVQRFLDRNRHAEHICDRLLAKSLQVFREDHQYSLKAAEVISFGLLLSAQLTFQEVVTLAANGFGPGAQARLRTMYEFVALAAHFIRRPEDAEKFIRFQRVEETKELLRAAELYATNDDAATVHRLRERLSHLERELQKLEARFGKSFRRSWHDGFEAISKNLGWQHHFFYDYLLPNRYVHASPRQLEKRISNEEQLYFEAGPDFDAADESFRGALTLLALSLAVADDLLKLKMHGDLEEMTQGLIAAYKGKPNKNWI